MTTVGGPRAGRHRADSPVADRDAHRSDAEEASDDARERPANGAYGDVAHDLAADRPLSESYGRRRLAAEVRGDQGYRPRDDHRPGRGSGPDVQYGSRDGRRPGNGHRPDRDAPPDERSAPREGLRPGDGYPLRREVPPDEQYRRRDGYPPLDNPRPGRGAPPAGYRRHDGSLPVHGPRPSRDGALEQGYRQREAYRPSREVAPAQGYQHRGGHQHGREARTEEAHGTEVLVDLAYQQAQRDNRPGQVPGERGYRQAEAFRRRVEPAPQPRSRPLARAKHLLAVLLGALLLIAIVALGLGTHVVRAPTGAMRLAFGWPGMRFLIYAVWMVPGAELLLLVIGQLNNRFRFKRAAPGTFSGMIIQITTTGREQDRVNEIIREIRGYRLRMRHRIWVVTEPGQRDHYPQADQVIVVPPDFVARSERKARALEYSRRIRVSRGLDRPDVKILFNDDDVTPTKGYLEKAFAAAYDVCEGVTAPRTEYAVRPLGHFLASHADDMRTHACLVYCSVFQGILGRPLHVHGEGLTVTGAAEGVVTWDWPAFASEDLVFGQRAARAGLRWGWFHEYVELTSPWTLRDFITQRRRWLWGDIHGIRHREVLSRRGAVLVAGKYLFGLITAAFSVAGLILRLTGQMPGQSTIYDVAKLSIVAWLAVFFACGWIGASSRASDRTNDSKLMQAITAVIMLPVSSLLTLAGVLIPLVQGNPRTFQVIRKTRQAVR
jgi:hypothetical protein